MSTRTPITPRRSGWCLSGDCESCPHTVSWTRRDKQGQYGQTHVCQHDCHEGETDE